MHRASPIGNAQLGVKEQATPFHSWITEQQKEQKAVMGAAPPLCSNSPLPNPVQSTSPGLHSAALGHSLTLPLPSTPVYL